MTHGEQSKRAAEHQARTGVMWQREPSYFAQMLALGLTQYGNQAMPLAQVYEKFAQNKDRAWFDREVRKLKAAAL